MTKRQIEKTKINLKEYYKGFDSLYEYSFFVYEVDVYICKAGSFNLQDSFNIAVNEVRAEGTFYTKKGNKWIIRDYTLKAAPQKWLIENKYIAQI